METKIVMGSSFNLPLANLPEGATQLAMVWIQPGTFLMGSSDFEDKSKSGYEEPFSVTISHGFWLGKYQVTQAQWQIIMKNNPSEYQECMNCPVEAVNWYGAINFCQTLNEIYDDELPRAYRFSLPTEAQWEYVCRAGTKTMYCNGNNISKVSLVAWNKSNSSGHPHPVGEKQPNGWGLYDMPGNVWEWCLDFPQDYPRTSSVDWIGKGDRPVRSFRGGAWSEPLENDAFRCTRRGYGSPQSKSPYVGFRLCLSAN